MPRLSKREREENRKFSARLPWTSRFWLWNRAQRDQQSATGCAQGEELRPAAPLRQDGAAALRD